jgi:NAD(P)-dependent dehydrogenase (short-subunit alcohol dehydrogenase family)
MGAPGSVNEGHRVVVTGATGTLGRAAARAFAERGASLALISSDQAKLDALARELHLPAGRGIVYAANLRDAGKAQSAARAVQERLGGADTLLHLVGGWVGGKTLAETDPHDLASMLDQHVWTTFNVIQAFIPLLVASGRGRFIVVSSPVATSPQRHVGAYAAAKAAEEALTLTLAQEVSKQGVAANIIQVSAIDAEHQRETAPSSSNASWTTPEEIVTTLLYLTSPEGGAANGARLTLAGRKG